MSSRRPIQKEPDQNGLWCHRTTLFKLSLFQIGNICSNCQMRNLITSTPNTKSVARRKGEQYGVRLKFAPWFDNGTSLGYQIIERKFSQWDNVRLDNFITKGTHHIRWAPDNLTQVGHLESMDFISKHNPAVRTLLLRKLKQFDTLRFKEIMDRLVERLQRLLIRSQPATCRRRIIYDSSSAIFINEDANFSSPLNPIRASVFFTISISPDLPAKI